jgi:hypothetical protein
MNCYPKEPLNSALEELYCSVNRLVVDHLSGTDDRSKSIVEKGNKVLEILTGILKKTS